MCTICGSRFGEDTTMKVKRNRSCRQKNGEDTRTRSLRILALLLSLVIVYASTTVLAQSDSAQISGFVKDISGAVIADVKVVVKSQTKSLERTAITSDRGYYVVSNLPPDIYSITVEHPGFKRYTVADKKVDPNIATPVDISLEV